MTKIEAHREKLVGELKMYGALSCTDDLNAIHAAHRISPRTIKAYFAGEIRNIGTALKIIKTMKAQIEDRERIFSN